VVVVLDPSLVGLVPITDGLKTGGILIVNTSKSAEEIRNKLNYKGKLFTVDATHIALEELGVPIANTTMLGAVLKATGVLSLNSLKSPLEHRFGRVASKNLSAMKRAFSEMKAAKAA
jgi:pyruvate ferredoxin oxidoreductase gamma subunit